MPLTNAPGSFAIIARHHHADLKARGLTGAWFLNSNGSGRAYVRTHIPVEGRPDGTNLLVARLIVGAGPNVAVRYANGNPLDLRYFNLVGQKGRSKRTDDELLAAAVKRRGMLEAAKLPPPAQHHCAERAMTDFTLGTPRDVLWRGLETSLGE